MRQRRIRLGLVAWTVVLCARAAYAGIFPSPFEFTFFNNGLTTLFLLPFQLAGCG